MYFSELETITSGKTIQLTHNWEIENLLIDSRKAIVGTGSVFFAISGTRNDGHHYITDLYILGIRQFVIEKDVEIKNFSDANFLRVHSSVCALQKVSQTHREQYTIPVIGITGSNGKTIVKEWLYQLLSGHYHIIKNPGSYNSQVGVPLSVWSMNQHHTLGIFEAGISKPLEMEKLERVIQPTVGIFTNIGPAHNEGFEDLAQKIKEKIGLFINSKIVVCCKDHVEIVSALHEKKINTFTWSMVSSADVEIRQSGDRCGVRYQKQSFDLILPFSDKAFIENCFHCVSIMLYLGLDPSLIQKKILELRPVSMRLELKEGINNCQLIDDTYNNDLAGLQISLDFLVSQQKKKKTVILSDILQSGLSRTELFTTISALFSKHRIDQLILIGPEASSSLDIITSAIIYPSTDDFLRLHKVSLFDNEIILIKGARTFQFEKIVHRLQRKSHGTVMQIDLSKMVHNFNFFKSKLHTSTKIMAMVKAFAYGSGSEEVANLLQYHKADYLGVAYADEGVDLRKKNISLPILVMNVSEESFDSLLSYQLEPAVYSLKLLQLYIKFLSGQNATIHLELETGMHRLGFDEASLTEAITLLKENPNIKIASVFSHLSASDEATHDGFSNEQVERFQRTYNQISTALKIYPIRHILNSAGILRLGQHQMDMVRLGIGLYGIDPSEDTSSVLQPVATLKTIISQIKKIKSGETVGYSRMGKAENNLTIATLAIGYADGFSRSFSRGKGFVLINGKKAPVIGNVCMDMTMVDISQIEAQEGDEVIVFGEGLPIQQVAKNINTIPYEILTNTSARVKRVFVAESI
mgnify:CR=1 FL=1